MGVGGCTGLYGEVKIIIPDLAFCDPNRAAPNASVKTIQQTPPPASPKHSTALFIFRGSNL